MTGGYVNEVVSLIYLEEILVNYGSGASWAEERRLIGRHSELVVVVVIRQRFRGDVGTSRVMMNGPAAAAVNLLQQTLIHHCGHFTTFSLFKSLHRHPQKNKIKINSSSLGREVCSDGQVAAGYFFLHAHHLIWPLKANQKERKKLHIQKRSSTEAMAEAAGYSKTPLRYSLSLIMRSFSWGSGPCVSVACYWSPLAFILKPTRAYRLCVCVRDATRLSAGLACLINSQF